MGVSRAVAEAGLGDPEVLLDLADPTIVLTIPATRTTSSRNSLRVRLRHRAHPLAAAPPGVARQRDGTTRSPVAWDHFRGSVRSGDEMIAGRAGGSSRFVGDGGLLALPVGLAVEDEFVGGGLEPVDRGLGEEGVGHEPEPLDWLPVAGHDRRRSAVPLDDEFVDVGGVDRVHRLESEVIDDEQVDAQQLADLCVVAVVEPARRAAV